MGQKTEKIFERAKVNLERDNHENALRLLNEVLNREPSHKQALRNKALIKIMNASHDEAEEFLLFAIEQQPEDDHLYQMLGTFYHNNGEAKKAMAQFEKAISANPENILAHQGMGVIYAQVFGKHQKAIAHFSKSIESGNNSADLLFSRGCSYMISEDMDKAEEDLNKAADQGHSKAEEMLEKYF